MTKTELPPLPEPERERFEAFHGPRKSKGVAHREAMFRRRPDGSYVCDSVQRHWWTWQNARTALAPLEAEVERLRMDAARWKTCADEITRCWTVLHEAGIVKAGVPLHEVLRGALTPTKEQFEAAWAKRWQVIGPDQVGASAKELAWATWQADRAAIDSAMNTKEESA
jgi:hypothetical protein